MPALSLSTIPARSWTLKFLIDRDYLTSLLPNSDDVGEFCSIVARSMPPNSCPLFSKFYLGLFPKLLYNCGTVLLVGSNDAVL